MKSPCSGRDADIFRGRRHDEGSIQLLVFGAGAADPSQANVILSEASLRAKSKDPLPVASVGVADPSQAQCHPERSEPASEVEGSATCRVERLGRGSFAGSG